MAGGMHGRGYAWQGAYIIFLYLITVPNTSFGKVMFPQACVKNYVHGGGGGACMAGECAWRGVHGGACGKGPAWQKGV